MELNNKSSMNNKIIILRKHLKSTINQTKLNLAKNIKKIKDSKHQKNSAARKESELECFKRVKVSDIPLALGVNPEKLKKQLTDPHSTEVDRVFSRVLLNAKVQGTITELTENYGVEFVETFLKSNEQNIQNNINQKLHKPKKKAKAEKQSESETECNNDGRSEIIIDDDLIPSDDEAVTDAETKNRKKGKSPILKKLKSTINGGAKKVSSAEKSLDSFFVNSGGEKYFAAVQNADSSSSESDEPKSKNTKAKAPKHLKKLEKSKKKVNEPKPVYTKPAAVAQESIALRKPKVSAEEKSDLHPSWVAKAQMRQIQIQEFKGTKIKFDD